jgi:hypothetical protein
MNEKDENTNCFVYDSNMIEKSNNKNIYLDGYFQNEKYFCDYKNMIYDLFIDHDCCLQLQKKYKRLNESYFIHVRRGDYLNDSLYSINYEKYYTLAINYIQYLDPKSYFYNPNVHFYILSNDIDFCRTSNYFMNISEENITFIEEDDPLSSLYIMSLCRKGGICCNSSFSWWGAYLNQNPDKTVLFPDNWIHNGKENDIYFEGSVQINSSF